MVVAMGRLRRVSPGLVRWLRQRIAERRPFEELPDGRFAAFVNEAPWDRQSPAEDRAAMAG